MAKVIGFVKELQNGEFFVKDAQGAIKALKAGDQIFENDLVYGAPNNPQNAQAIIDVTVGDVADIIVSGFSELLVDLSVIEGGFDKEEAVASTESANNAWRLTAGNEIDPNVGLDPTAAGTLEETAAGDQGPTDTERPGSTLFDARTGAIGNVATDLRFSTINGGVNIELAGNDTPNLNDQPVVIDVNGEIYEEKNDLNTIKGQLLAADADATDTHTFFAVEDSLTISLNGNPIDLSFIKDFSFTLNTDGSYTIIGDFNQFAVGENPVITFQYYAVDNGLEIGAPQESLPATVTIIVNGTNDQPVINNNSWLLLAGNGMNEGPEGSEEPTILDSKALIFNQSIDLTQMNAFIGGSVNIEDLFSEDNDTNPQDGTALKLFVSTSAGETVSFNWEFYDAEGDESPYNDFSFVVIDGQIISLLARSSDEGASNNGIFSYTFSDAGVHQIVFGVMNDDDTAVDSPLRISYISGGEIVNVEYIGTVINDSAPSVYETSSGNTMSPMFDQEEPDTVGDGNNVFVGNLFAFDEDASDEITLRLNGDPRIEAGVDLGDVSVRIFKNENGQWQYEINGDFNALAANEIATVTFDYVAVDDSGVGEEDLTNESDTSEPKTITLTIIGTNDQPIVSHVNLEAQNEAINGTNIFEGTLNVQDDDKNDEHQFYGVMDENEETVAYEVTSDAKINIETILVNTNGTYFLEGDFNALDEGETAQITFQYYAVDNSVTQDNGESSRSEVKTVTLTVIGTNDAPTITVNTGNIDNTNDSVKESGLPDGTNPLTSDTQATGTFTITDVDGLDDIKSITVAGTTFNAVASDGFAGIVGQTIPTPTYGEVTIVSYAGNGVFNYEYTLKETTTDIENATESDSFIVSVTDKNNVSANVTVTIDIVDDLPEAEDDSMGTVYEAGTLGGSGVGGTSTVLTGNLLDNDAKGADGATVTAIIHNSETYDTIIEGMITVNTDSYSLVVNSVSGAYTFTLKGDVEQNRDDSFHKKGDYATDTATLAFDYILEDGDGDISEATMSVSVADDGPQVNWTLKTIAEVGTEETPNTITGNLTLVQGADGGQITEVSLSGLKPDGQVFDWNENLWLTSGGEPVIVTQTGLSFVGKVGTAEIFSLSIDANGSYTFTQSGPIDHIENAPNSTQWGTDNNDLFVHLHLKYTVTDGDGDQAYSWFGFDITDDVPSIVLAETMASSFRVDLTNYDFASSAGYNSSFGYYIKGEGGVPTSGVVIWDGVKAPNANASYEIVGYSPEQIGFFIIPNGNNKNSTLTNETEVTFKQVDGSWQIFIGETPLTGQGASVLFDNPALNGGTYEYMKDNTLPGNLNWEDIAGGGDRDNNDININSDWTSGILTVDESRLDIDATANLSSAFVYDFGADGAGTKSYALSKGDGNTGLFDTASGTEVTLHVNGDVIEGRAGGESGEVVFTLSVDANGKVTLDQQRAVFHGDANNPDDSVGLNTGLITLKTTITDFDGDSDEAMIDIGALIRFEDDAPLAFSDSKTTNEDAVSISGNVVNNDSVGADGISSVSFSKTAGTYGTLSYDSATGSYTYTLNPNAQTLAKGASYTENFDYTLTDKDGDTSKSTLSIKVSGKNDAPVIDLDGTSNTYTESFENLITTANSWTVISTPVFRGDAGMVWETQGGRNGLEVQNGNVGGSLASAGAVHAELDSHELVTLSTKVSISESDATLSFDYKPRPGSLTDSDMKVTLGNVTFTIDENGIVGGFSGATVTTNANGWMSVVINVSGLTAGEQVLSFEGLGNSNSLGAYLDNIALVNGSMTSDTGYETTFIENGTAVSIADTDISISDVDDTNIENATITLMNAKAGDFLSAGTMPAGISLSIVGNVVTLTGSATLANYQEAIKAISFGNTSDNPDTTDRVINVIVNDGNDNSNTATTIVHVKELNDGPVAVDDAITTNEDTPFKSIIDLDTNDTDPDGDALSVVAGTFTTTQGGTIVVGSDGSYTYTPAKNFSGVDTVNYTVTDGQATDIGKLTITVNPVADAPSLIMSLSSPIITLGANLIINGSFEDVSGINENGGVIPNDVEISEGGLVKRLEIPGWKLDTAQADALAPDIYFYNGDSYFVGNSGDLKDSTSSANALTSTTDGYGISGGGGNDSVDKNETLLFDLHAEVSNASFAITNVKGATLGAQWIAYDKDGNEVGRGGITDTVTLNLTTANTSGKNFQYVAFDAEAQGNGGRDGFFVKSLQTSTVTSSMPPMEPHDDGHAGVGSTDGENYMDLGASPGNTAIYQDISGLTQGAMYRLSVDYRDKAAMQEGGQSGRDSGVMQVLWNGAIVATIEGNNTAAWETLVFDLVAIEGVNRLTFNEIGVADDNWGMAIDNVQLQGVTYSYDLSVNATLTDDSEVLGNVEISNLPIGSQLVGGNSIDVESGVTEVVTLQSNNPLSVENINAIKGSLTSTDAPSVTTTEEHTIATVDVDGNNVLILPSGGDIDFGILSETNNPFDGVGVIDLSAAGANTLANLSLEDVIDMTDGNNTLTILGDNSDSVNIPAVSSDYSVSTTTVGGFDVYTYTSSNASDPTVVVKIDQDIQQS